MTLAEEHYSALGSVSVLLRRDLAAVWRALEGVSAEAAVLALMDTVPGVGEMYGDMAAALAVDFYESAREAADAPGRFVAKAAPLPSADRFDSLVRWGAAPLFGGDPQPAAALARVGGGLQRVVTDVARETIVVNSTRDPKATGWRRVGGGGCKWCQMLIGRGAVYSAASVRFKSHDHCRCVAAPKF